MPPNPMCPGLPIPPPSRQYGYGAYAQPQQPKPQPAQQPAAQQQAAQQQQAAPAQQPAYDYYGQQVRRMPQICSAPAAACCSRGNVGRA